MGDGSKLEEAEKKTPGVFSCGVSRGAPMRYGARNDSWSLFRTVHLDADEGIVQQLRHLRVSERFVGHDVAPVAGGVANGEEDGLVELSGGLEGFRPPGIPVHGVLGVLEEIGAFLLRQPVPALG
jgi:hypothetical protein